MLEVDLKQKISFQRPFTKNTEIATDQLNVIRQFESDRGRIINSAPIRRLQQKTQVFPLERNAAVRSRLTHSLEVQQVGRHIVKEIFVQLEQRTLLDQYGLRFWQVPIESLVEMACLMHDIGNPPFGHFGEKAINHWFSERLKPDAFAERGRQDTCQIPLLRLDHDGSALDHLRRQVRQDLCQFEGNAQAIRLVFTLQRLNLTYAQIGCILKYTKPAYWQGEVPEALSYLMKKPGYYLSEEAFITELAQALQLQPYHRFSLTYIMEAADDISYCIADLEDAVEKGILSTEKLVQYLRDAWGVHDQGDVFDQTVGEAYRHMRRGSDKRSMGDQFFMYLRVKTIACLVPYVVRRFIADYAQIMDGSLNHSLLDKESSQFRLLTVFKQVAAEQVFSCAEVELLELQGYRVISGLLDIYSVLLHMPLDDFSLLARQHKHSKYPIETRLWHKISVKQRLAYEEAMMIKQQHLCQKSTDYAVWEYYYRARLLQDYISGMTDLYAYDEYRRLMVVTK